MRSDASSRTHSTATSTDRLGAHPRRHARARRRGRPIVAHGAVVQRRLLHRDRALRTGYVEGIAVRADRRRRGYGRAVMSSLDGVIRAAYELGALSAAHDGAAGLYRSLGWRRWEGRTWVIAPDGLRRTPDDDESTYVLPLGAAARLRRRSRLRLAGRRRLVSPPAANPPDSSRSRILVGCIRGH